MRGTQRGQLEFHLVVLVTLGLVAFGLVMVYSASSARGLLAAHDPAYYLKRQALYALVGVILLAVLARVDYRRLRSFGGPLLLTSAVLLVAVLVVGTTVNGARRWIPVGSFGFQPSELAKLALAVWLAAFLVRRAAPRTLGELLRPVGLVLGLLVVLLLLEPDLGTSMIIASAVGCLLFLAGVRLWTLAPVALAVGVIAVAVVASNPYQQERLTGFLNPGADPGGAGFQSKQATIAVGSGGIFGVGLGESVQKASYLPEAHTDMVAAVIGEELGLVGVFVLVGLFGMFGYAGLRAAHRARDRFSKLLAAGLTSLILAQAALNLFAVFGLAPLTGVPLPFVSYGGTSLVITLASAGLILNVARRPAAQGAGRRTSGGTGRAGPSTSVFRKETAPVMRSSSS